MKTRILAGVLGKLILEIKILTGARKVIGILDLVILIKTPVGKAMAAGALEMLQVMISLMLEMKVQMKILIEVVETGEVVTRVEVALEVEDFGVEENAVALAAGVSMGALVAGETVVAGGIAKDLVAEEALVAEENVEALVAGENVVALVVDGDQTEAVAGEGVINPVVGATEGILVRMGPLTGRMVVDLRAGAREAEVSRAGVLQVVGLMIMGTMCLAGTKELEISRAGVHQVVELMIMETTLGLAGTKQVEISRLPRLAGKNLLQLKRLISKTVGGTRDLVQTLLLRAGVNQVLLTRDNRLVGENQQMVRQVRGARKMTGVTKVDGNCNVEQARWAKEGNCLPTFVTNRKPISL